MLTLKAEWETYKKSLPPGGTEEQLENTRKCFYMGAARAFMTVVVNSKIPIDMLDENVDHSVVSNDLISNFTLVFGELIDFGKEHLDKVD